MSATLQQTSIRDRVEDLNQMILNGQILDAFDKYYAQDVVMADNFSGNREGFKACREFEESFVANLKEFRGAEVQHIEVDEESGLAFVKWHFDYVHEEWGHMDYVQVAVQRWKDGKIVHERFLYDS